MQHAIVMLRVTEFKYRGKNTAFLVEHPWLQICQFKTTEVIQHLKAATFGCMQKDRKFLIPDLMLSVAFN